MEAGRELPAAEEPSLPAGLRGLVVQTGRGVGSWQPLRSPVTLVGRSPGCDVRIDASGVRAMHCMLAPGSDGVSLRSVHAGGVRVNGHAANAAVLRDGDVITIGPTQFRLRWPALTPTHDPALEALRIQAAAVVAQQAALFEQEIALHERETALDHQEGQLAGHLEEKRRQLLDLQDQITAARERLRQKRAAHETMTAEQDRALALAREEAAEHLVHAKSERQRLLVLYRKIKERWRRERKKQKGALAADWASLRETQARFDAEHERTIESTERHNAEIELDKRRLRDAWQRLQSERKGWTAQKAGQESELRLRLHDLAQRAKAVRGAEARFTAERDQVAKELHALRQESEHLDTRIGRARERLLEMQGAAIAAQPAAPPAEAASQSAVPDDAAELRTQRLAQIALELSDQRLWLAEQVARLNRGRQEWHAEREQSSHELQTVAASLAEQEKALARRARDVTAAEQRVQSECDALTQMRLRQEAERTRGEARLNERGAEHDRQASELSDRTAALCEREARLADVLKTWGLRRRQAIETLQVATRACRDERAEWAAARTSWLHELEKIAGERRDLAARALALEQSRIEWLADEDRTPAVQKRLERLERQWETQCAATLRDLLRLRSTLETESARLDRAAEETREEREQATVALTTAEERLAQADAASLKIEADRSRSSESVDSERADRTAVEAQVAGLRGEVESLARLFIDAPRPIDRAA